MKKDEILKHVDHTLLTQTASWKEIKVILDDAIKYQCASACIPPYYVKKAKEYVKDKLKICTVIGFPNGYHTTEVKVFETRNACENGADEIDMVINLAMVNNHDYDAIESEIKEIKKVCENRILKVIVETCLLSEEQLIQLCKVVTNAKADYMKTSTGFSISGATFKDVQTMKQYVGENIKIKAAGGIRNFEDAEKFIELGASRLGTSRLVKLMKEN